MCKKISMFILTLLFMTGINGGIDSSCINCIGKIEGGGRGCQMDGGSLSCGLYQIKHNYWIDCNTGSAWKTCVAAYFCARRCIRRYMDRYGYLCARALGKNVSSLTCEDYGRLHNGGPYGCSKNATLPYVDTMREKCHFCTHFFG
ncbi:lysozyme-like [Watersipora subatra]|uniref:lysozyme-like n=1 Tax=Watersipora subatra TaxID=2589382 RepID=UPI00355BA45F